MNLAVDLCGIPLSGPLILGSGGLGESAESLDRFQRPACSAVVIRTLREHIPEDRAIFPSPHLAMDRRRRWLLNCEWGNLRDLEYWIETGLPRVAERGRVFASVSGREEADCRNTLTKLAGAPIDMVEINFSCSHAGQLFGRILDDPRHVGAVIAAAKQVCSVPVAAKLGWSPVLERVSEAAERAGCDAITVTNAIGPGLDVDIESASPRLGIAGGFGGLSGPAILPIALECVRRVVSVVSVPVIGVGGVSTSDDLIKMLLIGARCVQIYTAPMLRGPKTFDRILSGLTTYMTEHRYESLDDFRGSLLPILAGSSYVHRRLPVVDAGRCVPCGACERICPADAIHTVDIAEVDASRCTGCGICVDACPPGFSALSLEPRLGAHASAVGT